VIFGAGSEILRTFWRARQRRAQSVTPRSRGA